MCSLTDECLVTSSEETRQQHRTVCKRHLGASVRVPERRLQEGREAGEGLEDLHHRGHRPDGVLHPQRGEFTDSSKLLDASQGLIWLIYGSLNMFFIIHDQYLIIKHLEAD